MNNSRSFNRLTCHVRHWIFILLKENHSIREIARIIGIHHSTISREIKNNSVIINNIKTYEPKIAHDISNHRLKTPRTLKIQEDKFLLYFIYKKLKETWSPDVIAGYLKKQYPAHYVSHETIYSFIYNIKQEWIPLLFKSKKRRLRRYNKYHKRCKVKILHRISIENRPKYIDKKKSIGHFEIDTIVSRSSKDSILVIHERKSKKTFIKKLLRKDAVSLKNKTIDSLKKYSNPVKSITYDNGTENALHYEINIELGCKSYFCNPYHSWEKGSVEHVNGLIRRFIPKRTDLSKVTQNYLDLIQNIINNRPRKSLNYLTPNFVFNKLWCNRT